MRQMLDILRRTYCGTIGIEYMHIADPEQKSWLQQRIEGADKEIALHARRQEGDPEQARSKPRASRNSCDVKFIGTKRFGLDGAESLIPALEQIIKRGGQLGAKEIVLGMPHRGRLNVLANVMAKPYRAIFHEFQGGSANPDDVAGSGDVKYHLGASSDREFDGNKVHLSLAANPSHLEAVDPVVLGKARAKQAQHKDRERTSVIPLLHARRRGVRGPGHRRRMLRSCRAQGLPHRRHDPLHRQQPDRLHHQRRSMRARRPIRPTSPRWSRRRSSTSTATIPKRSSMSRKVATEFRQKFHKDVVIDMFCYRRFGHNEGDEPAFTQPLMYSAIKEHPTTLEIYAQKLVDEGMITAEEFERDESARSTPRLEQELEAAIELPPEQGRLARRRLVGLRQPADDDRRGETAVDADVARDRRSASRACPKAFTSHQTIARLLEQKRKMIADGEASTGRPPRRSPSARCLLEGYRRAARPARIRPRHLQPAPRRARRSGNRGALRAAQQHRPRPGRVRSRRFAAVGSGRARLRIRLQPGRAQRAGAVGSAVRRFRQRRAGHHRPVHRLGRDEVAAHVRPRAAAAARLRRPGAGAFLGAARALPAALRRGQHPGRATARRRPTISTSCAGRCTATSASRWS